MIYTGKHTIFNHSEQFSLQQLIRNADENAIKKREEGKSSFSLRIAKYMATSGLGDIFDVVDSCLSALMAVLHATNTYFDPDTPSLLELAETVLNLLFAFSGSATLEYISVLPSFLATVGAYSATNLVKLTRVLRFLCIYKMDKILARHSSEVSRYMFSLVFTMVAILIVGSCCLLLVENTQANSQYMFHDFLYFMVVTLTTVGFGDVYPRTSLGQLLVVCFLVILLVVFPPQYQALIRAMNLRSKYARISFQRHYDTEHIVIIGSSGTDGFKTFLTELYHTDHGLTDMHSVILQPNPPNEGMLALIKMQTFASKVMYLEGSPLQVRDQKRAALEHSKCVIILANKTAKNPQAEDYRNILHTFAVKHYAKSMLNREIRVCLQVLRQENKELFADLLKENELTQIVCADELKLFLLAKTCICPGINTIISCLITSNKPQLAPQFNNPNTSKESILWIDDYLLGMQNEIYRIPLNQEVYSGITFSKAAQNLYNEYSLILFALEITIDGETHVYLNPSDYVFQDMKHYAYIIAASLSDVQKIQNFRFSNDIERNFNTFTFSKKTKVDADILSKKYKLYSEQKKLKTQQQQEKESKNKAFYMGKINSLESATIKHLDDIKLKNHIIVCGIVPGMKHLLYPLRAKSLKTIYPVVIMYNDSMPTSIWQQINRFPKVYFLQGNPLKPEDLDRVCLQSAMALVILSRHGENENSHTTTMVDADSIFIYKTVKSYNPNIRIITELAALSTISFLSQAKNELMQKYGHIASEPFASGEVYISTMLDTLICQAFYNPYITSILNQMIMGSLNVSKKIKKKLRLLKLQQSNVFLVAVPIKYLDKTFGQLFDYLINEHKMIAISLYRGERIKYNTKPYVYIKPQADVKILSKDRVFVLCAKEPKGFDTNLEDEERNNLIRALMTDGPAAIIKSNLTGEEGKTDTEVARELNKVNQELRSCLSELKNINQDTFAQGLTTDSFIPDVRSLLKTELANFHQMLFTGANNQ